MTAKGPAPDRRAPDRLSADLAPIVATLQRAADVDCQRIRRDADEQVARIRADARAEVHRIAGEARQAGRRVATGLIAEAEAEAQRQAREAVLAARRQALDDLRAAAIADLAATFATPEGQALRDRLMALVSEAGGRPATVEWGTAGPVFAAGPADHRAETSAAMLVDQAMAALAPEMPELCR